MSEKMKNPYCSREYQQPLDDNWAARRSVAASARRLIENLLTRSVSADTLHEMAAVLDKQVDVLERGTLNSGRMSYAASGEHGNIVELDYELSPLNGQVNALAPPMHVWVEGDRVRGRVIMGWPYEGPPNSVHGGLVAALFDQLLGVGQTLTDKPGFTGTLSVRYLHKTPLNTELRLEGWVDRVEGRKNFLVGEMWAGDIKTACCEGLFISVDGDGLGTS